MIADFRLIMPGRDTYVDIDKSKHLCTLLTEMTHLTMYMKSAYKIKVGHKRCVVLPNSFDSDPLCYA